MLNLALQVAAALAIPAVVLLYFNTHRNWHTVREAIWVAFGLGVIVAVPIAAVEYVIALPFSGLVNIPLLSAVKAFAMAAVPEETGKFLILVFFVMRHEDFSRPIHAIAFATAVSLGFAAIENVLYVLESPDWAATALARSLTALPMHTAAGLVMGYFAALTISAPQHRRRYGVLMLALPIILHTAYNFPVFALVSLGAFAGVPVDVTASPYYLMFALALATCIGVIVTVFIRMHQTGQPPAAAGLQRR